MKKTDNMIKKCFRVVWPLIFVVLITILYAICIGVVIGLIYLSIYLYPEVFYGNIVAVFLMSFINFYKMGVILLTISMQFLWIVVFYRWNRRITHSKPETSTRFLSWKNLGLIMLLAVGNHLLISGAMDLLIPHLGKLGEDYIDMMNVFFEGNVILTFISTIILAPISEELIFRGVIMKKARHAFPFAVANVMQALLFGVLHGNIIQGSYAFVLGLSLGYVTYKFESILPAILIHCMLNLLGSYLLYSVPTFVQILEVILGIGIIVYTVRILNKMKPYVSMDIN